MFKLNDRSLDEDLTGMSPQAWESMRLRVSILAAYPEDDLETVVIQWEKLEPTLLVQLKYDPLEPLQFPGERKQVTAPESALPAREAVRGVVPDVLDPSTSKPFLRPFREADILISKRAFARFQPHEGAVMPAQMLWEMRDEILRQLHLPDQPGTTSVQGA